MALQSPTKWTLPRAFALSSLTLGFGLSLSSCNLAEVFNTTGLDSMNVEEKVVLGLRQALSVGIDSSAFSASKVNAYLGSKVFKILMPDDAIEALETIESISAYVTPYSEDLKGIQSLVEITPGLDETSFGSNVTRATTILTDVSRMQSIGDSVVHYMNRAAEIAAPRSVPIFKKAITQMSIGDGLTLLNSPDSTAATAYLDKQTFSPLVTAYSPLVDSTLALVPLTQYWGDFRKYYNTLITNYNALLAFQNQWNSQPVVSSFSSLQVTGLQKTTYEPIVTENLGEWTTTHALKGLFYLVGEEEKDIRKDPFGYVKNLTSDVSKILKEVFGEIMQMEK
jgi:Protein of unknown function (DUF4197)